jgi:hypothetical protein
MIGEFSVMRKVKRSNFFTDKTVADFVTSILRIRFLPSARFSIRRNSGVADFPPDEILAWQISSSADPLGHAHDCLRGSP